jgi:hypothetical protein
MRIRLATTSSSSSCASRTGLLVVLALVAAVAACGGDDDSEARRQCIAAARSAAEVEVVATFFQAGRIGTREQIERELDHPSLRFFDENGQLLPYEELTPAARAAFSRWLVDSRAGDVTFGARQEARDEADTEDC